MSQITLIFIRHGEAASSWVSHEDPGLSIKGQDEAKALLANKDLQNLENYEFISSPRKRAIDTSKPLAAKFNKKFSSCCENPDSGPEIIVTLSSLLISLASK